MAGAAYTPSTGRTYVAPSGHVYTSEGVPTGQVLNVGGNALVSGGGAQQMPPIANVGSPGGSMLGKLVLFAGVAGLAYYAYKKMAKRRSVQGVAFVDDGEDDAGEAIRAPKRFLPVGAPPRSKSLGAKLVGTVTTTPRRKYGRKVANLLRDENDDDAEEYESDPGENPSVPLRLEADEKLYKNQKQYREDMKTQAWDRAAANNHPVDVVARGTRRVLYSAKPL